MRALARAASARPDPAAGERSIRAPSSATRVDRIMEPPGESSCPAYQGRTVGHRTHPAFGLWALRNSRCNSGPARYTLGTRAPIRFGPDGEQQLMNPLKALAA